MEYSEKNLWEYSNIFFDGNPVTACVPYQDVEDCGNAVFCESWSHYIAKVENINKHKYVRMPIHFYWVCDCSTFREEYSGDLLFLSFLNDYSLSIKVCKEDEPKIRDYLKSIYLL